MNVSKCSGWNGRVNELGEMSSGALDTGDALALSERKRDAREKRAVSRARLACLAHISRTTNEEGGFFEGVEQPLGNFQITPPCTNFDVRLGDTVEIASTGHQQVQSLG